MRSFQRLVSLFLASFTGLAIVSISVVPKPLFAQQSPSPADGEIVSGEALYEKGKQLQETNQYQAALETLQQALTRYEAEQNPEGQAKTLVQLGKTYDVLSDYEQMGIAYRQALELARSSGSQIPEGYALNGVGDIYYYQNDYARAEQLYREALDLFIAANELAGQAESLNNIGSIYYDGLEDYSQALEYYERSLAIRTEISDRFHESEVLNNIGFIYSQIDQLDQSLEIYQKSLVSAQLSGNRKAEQWAMQGMGAVHWRRSEFGNALEKYQGAFQIAVELEDQKAQLIILNGLAFTHERLSNYEQSLKIYQDALLIAQRLNDISQQCNNYQGIGRVQQLLGNLYAAGISFQKSLEISRQHQLVLDQGYAYLNLGNFYKASNLTSDAEAYYKEALLIAESFSYLSLEATTLTSLGWLYHDQQRYDEAMNVYQRSLLIHLQQNNRLRAAASFYGIGRILNVQDHTNLAIIFYKQSVSLIEKMRENLQNLSQTEQQEFVENFSGVYRGLADLLLQNDRILEAQQVLDLLKIEELNDYLNGIRSAPNTELTILRPEQQILAQYNEVQGNAIALGQELTALRQRGREQELSDAEKERLRTLTRLQGDLKGLFNDFIEDPQVQAWVQELAASFSATDQSSVDLQQLAGLQSTLQQLNAAIIYPLILEDRIELILTTPNQQPIRRTVEVDRAQFNETILGLRQLLSARNDAQAGSVNKVKAYAQRLYSYILYPLEEDLKAAGVDTLIYAPDGQLRYIPFSALWDGEQWIAQRFSVQNITSLSLQNLIVERVTNPSVLAGAYADEGAEYVINAGTRQFPFKGLPFARKEVENLTSLLPGTTALIDRDFSFDEVEVEMQLHNVLHFATHAQFVAGDPEESFIVFGDGGHSTVRDISNWTLDGVDLVVLSACETGLGAQLGDGKEILGLGYQFQAAGARSTLASLWMVDDGGTQQLMTAFYRALNEGQTKAQALQTAQKVLIESGDLIHPYYWSPFILIGNGL